MIRRANRAAWAVLGGSVLGLLGVLGAPATPAAAHAVLSSTVPTQSAVVPQAPTQVMLTFTETVNPIQDKVRVVAPDGSRADTGQPRISGNQVIIPLKGGGAQGTYLVTYRVLSADSHPVAGAFTYSVGAVSPGGPPSADGPSATASTVVEAMFPVVRWIGYAGLLLLVGATVVMALLWPQRLDRSGPVRIIWLGAGLVAAATVLELLLQVPYVAGGGLGSIRGADVREVLSSQFGAAHLIRLGVLGAALLLLRPIVRGKGWGADRVLLAVLGTIGVATWSVSGHPSASRVPMITVTADMIHIAAMSVWLGGLVMLVFFLLPRASAPELGAVIPIWSRWATYAVAALLLTGVTQSLVEVGTLTALVTTTYGWLLIAKIALVGVVLGVASLSRGLVGHIAASANSKDRGASKRAAARLRGLVMAEAAVAAVVLGVTSVLVQTSPTPPVSEPTSATVQSAVLKDKLFTLTVDVVPAKVGLNDIHLTATTPDGLPADIKQWTVRATESSQGIEPIDANVLPITPDHAIGQIGVPAAGTWTFTFTLRTTEVDQATVTTEVTVRP